MKFSTKKKPVKIPHPSIDLVKNAYVSEDGLWAIHKEESLDLDRNGNWIINYYVLTHMPSGAKMPWTFSSLKQTKAFCKDISQIADWKSLKTKVVGGKMAVMPDSLRRKIGKECADIYKQHVQTDR